MKMTNLKALHASMKAIGVDIQTFRARTGAAEFECIFSTRETPYSLALTSRGRNPKFLLFEVKLGYFIADYVGDQYDTLHKALFVDGRSGEPLIPKTWLGELNAAVPQKARLTHAPGTAEIARLRPDIEETDRPYFDTWIFWADGRKPSEENRKKTLCLLGSTALEYSRKNKASSKWSAEPTGRNWQS